MEQFRYSPSEQELIPDLPTYLNISLAGLQTFYETPVDFLKLSQYLFQGPYHGPILSFKAEQLSSFFIPHKLLNRQTFNSIAHDFVIYSNCYLQEIFNGFGKVIELKPQLACYMRRVYANNNPNTYLMIKYYPIFEYINFSENEIIHLKGYNPFNQIYGIPDYIGGLNSIYLGARSTKFRVDYTNRNFNLGYILAINDAGLSEDTQEELKKKLQSPEGFKNIALFLNKPSSITRNSESIKIVHVANIGANDLFKDIQEVTEGHALAMHRMQPNLSGIIPDKGTVQADINKTYEAFFDLEIFTLQNKFLEINEIYQDEIIRFKTPDFKLKNAKQ